MMVMMVMVMVMVMIVILILSHKRYIGATEVTCAKRATIQPTGHYPHLDDIKLSAKLIKK
jgi:ABC-type cobalt transport system substrate-binding protein